MREGDNNVFKGISLLSLFVCLNMSELFSPEICEQLRYYVYALQDPRDGKIFYIGKGVDNRVFAHAHDALTDVNRSTDKLDTIRDIIKSGQEVKYYILRHDLDENEAFTVESVLIDFLTYSGFNNVAKLSNIQSGHHMLDKGIMTEDDIRAQYACEPIEMLPGERVLSINLNKSYSRKSEPDDGKDALYEAVRKYWRLSKANADRCDYVLAEYHGVCRGVFKVDDKGWQKSDSESRYFFEGTLVDDPQVTCRFVNRKLPPKPKGFMSPVRYLPSAGTAALVMRTERAASVHRSAEKQQEPRVLTIKQTNMAKVFEDDYSIKYVIIKTKQETVEEVGRYEATRKAWKMKLENISQYPYALSVQDGIVKAVYKVDAWKSAAEVGVPDRVMFDGKAVDDAEITKKFVGKMIPECYRKKGQASPVLYQKREGEEDTED